MPCFVVLFADLVALRPLTLGVGGLRISDCWAGRQSGQLVLVYDH